MKKKTRTLIILGAVLVVCIGAYIGVSIYSNNQAQKTAAESQATQIYPNSMSAPVSISYETSGKKLSFVLENEMWYVADNKDFPLTQTALTSLVTSLNGLTAVRTLDMPVSASLSAYGLDQPSYTVTASDSTGNMLKLLIGIQNGDNYYAMTEGGNKIYTIASTLVGYLKPDIMSMIVLDKIPALSESSIDTMGLLSGTSALTLDKHQNKDSTYSWFIVNGTSFTAADELVLPEGSERSAEKYVSNAVAALSGAKFTLCAAFRPADDALKAYGLDVPKLTVTVDYTTTTGTGMDQTSTPGSVVIEIGAPLSDGTGYYARVQGSQEINVLSNDNVAPLFEALTAMGTAG